MTMSQVDWQRWLSRGARATRAVTLFVLAASAASSVASVLWHYESLADNGVADVLGAGDVNGDGADDLVVTELHTDTSGPEPVPGVRILLFLGAYDGTFATAPSWTGFVPDGQSRYGQIAAADVDADGFSDIVAVAQDFTEDWDCARASTSVNCTSNCVQGKVMVWRGSAAVLGGPPGGGGPDYQWLLGSLPRAGGGLGRVSKLVTSRASRPPSQPSPWQGEGAILRPASAASAG